MHVYSPCDVYELRSMMKHMAASDRPVYMQLVRPKLDAVFDEDYSFDPLKAVVLREGTDVTLVSTGYMTQFTPGVADALAEEGISVELLHYPSVKPFDADTLVASARKTGGVVTVENQSILGGLGGAVCEVLSEQCPTPVKRLGVPDQFGEVASEDYLFEKHGFGPKHIADACRAMHSDKQ
jgi:transketolase